MKARFLTLSLFAALGMTSAPSALAEDAPAASGTPYNAIVDASAFREVVLEHKKIGVTTVPATIRQIVPGMDKFSIYPLIGPPHFGEGITRRWNYVLFFPPAAGEAERVRCRMEIRFKKPRGQYSVVVSEVVWQDQACMDRVAQAS